MRLVQLLGAGGARRVAAVEDDRLLLLDGCASVCELALEAIDSGTPIADVAARKRSETALPYDAIYAGTDPEWRLLPAFDHPDEPARCLVSGTGLTHRRSAANRQAMHAAAEQMTDSMRMYQSGLERGRPQPGDVGVAPEWFYKGSGSSLRAHNEPLEVPDFAGDGGEEPEIAAAYIVDQQGQPWRVGMMTGNEFSDHITEKENYLYLAASKLRDCSVGPELVLDPDFSAVKGRVTIEREGGTVWSRDLVSGEANMCHSLANIEHHHFKFPAHRRPGDVHIHFFGADAFSFGEGVRLQDGDVMQVEWLGCGRPLRNPLRSLRGPEWLRTVKPI
ncbi:MAG TPA: AraD1 family protein [Bryobacteraceae bacterium]|nr:AraD1 family protein [Bryobacteraceae bacterium]